MNAEFVTTVATYVYLLAGLVIGTGFMGHYQSASTRFVVGAAIAIAWPIVLLYLLVIGKLVRRTEEQRNRENNIE